MDNTEAFWKWASTNDLCGLTAAVAVVVVLVALVNATVRLSQMLTRLILVWVRGWPPPHLDADGDHHVDEPSKKTKK